MKRIGSRLEVINGLAMKTSGGLKVNDLIINKRGKVVSKKLHEKAIKQYGGTVNINKYKSITELHNIPNNLRTYKNNMIGKTAKLNLMTKDNLNVESPYKYEKLIFQLLFRLNPPIKNIVKHIEFIDDKKTIYMEYCGKDLMYYIIKNKGPTTYIDILKFMKTLTKIILDLHGNGLILYDIKPVNTPSDYREEWVECWTAGGNFTIHENVEVIEMARKTLKEGEIMFHSYNDYHDLELNTEHAVTKVKFDFSWPYPTRYRGKIYPKIVRPNNGNFVGAANNYGKAEDNWEIIDTILNEI